MLPAGLRLGGDRGTLFDFGSRREFGRRLGMDLSDERGLCRFFFGWSNFLRLSVGKVSWPCGPPPTMKRLALDRRDARPENRKEEKWPFI